MTEKKKGLIQTALFIAAIAALFLVKYQGIPIGVWAIGLAIVALYHPMTAEVITVSMVLTPIGLIAYMVTSRLGRSHRVRLVLTSVLLAILAISHISMSYKLGGLRQQFRSAASQSAEWVNHGVVGEEQYTGLDYGGSLDEIVAKRNAVLADNGYTIIGRWEVGDSGVRFGGFYLWIGPLARLR